MTIENGSKVSDTVIEFDIYLKSASSYFILTSYQCVFTFNDEIINNGNISFSYVPGSSQLINIPTYGIGLNTIDNQLKLTFASLVGSDTIYSTPKRIGKFRIINSQPFTGLGLSLNWNFSGIINSILTGEYFANITNPSYHTNYYISWDMNPPAIQSAALTDSTKLIITFSEILDTTNVKNINNYSITNGVIVLSAVPLNPGNKISLTTSAHSLGNSYIVSVQNLRDISGNTINGTGSSANYSFGEFLTLNIKILLQGPYSNGIMKKTLNELKYIPKHQPFNVSPWNYLGAEQVTVIPPTIVDWILVELRSGISNSTTVAKKAAFLKQDGSIVDLDGSSYLSITGIPGSYYLVIRHRSHLGVMSSNQINLTTAVSSFDFSTSVNSTYGTNSMVSLGNNLFGLYAGDANGNGNINNTDLTAFWKKENGKVGYKPADFDLNGGVNIVDRNVYWENNKGKATNIP